MTNWIRIALLAVLAGGTLAPAPARANDAAAYAAAEAAIRAFRDESFLVNPCERAFGTFWRALRATGVQGLVYQTSPFGTRQYFVYGNMAAEPALDDAVDICRRQAGDHGDMVLRVLRDRALEKERLRQQFQHAERIVAD